MWKDLTLQQKVEIMRMSVANGVTDINSIQRLYDNSAGHLYNKAGPLKKKNKSKYQYGIIEQILRENGVNFRVTSGFRHPNEAGNAGKSSAHTYSLISGSPAAIDIVPGTGSDWNTLYKQMSSPKVRAALAAYGLDILDETNPATMAKTKATGKHFHVGRGIKGQSGQGVFIGSTNPTVAAFNRVYGNSTPSLDIDYDVLEPSNIYELDWSNRPQEEEYIIQRPTEPIMAVMEREDLEEPIQNTQPETDNFFQIPSLRVSVPQIPQLVAQEHRQQLQSAIAEEALNTAPVEMQELLTSPYIIFGRT